MERAFDLVIIGCGAAGVEAAKEALKYTKKVLCIDKSPESIGGTCLNRGCVPTKHLREGAFLLDTLKESSLYGITAQAQSANFSAAVEKVKSQVIKPIRENTYKYLRGRGVKFLFSQEVKFLNPNTLTVGGKKITSRFFLLATGSRAQGIPNLTPDGEYICTTDTIWETEELPQRVLIVGGGVSGVEFANIFKSYGAKEVYIVEIAPSLLGGVKNLSPDVVKRLERTLKAKGIKIFTSTAVEEVDPTSQRVKLSNGQTLEGIRKVLLTVGRRPNSDHLGLEKIGVELAPKGFVKVKKGYQTAVKNIYAVGDLIETPALAHVAKHEALLAVANMFKNTSRELDYNLVPSVVYSALEIGSFGLEEKELKGKGIKFSVKMATFRAVAKALSEREEGLVKVFTDQEGHLLGANVVSRKHTDAILHLLLMAKSKGLKVETLREIVWAHPTVEEVLELLP